MQGIDNGSLYNSLCCFDRVAESTEEVIPLRPPRLIREDGIIRPYDRGEAEGYDLFEVRSDVFSPLPP